MSGRHVKQHQANLTMLNVNKNTLEREKSIWLNVMKKDTKSQYLLALDPEEDTVIIVDPETGAGYQVHWRNLVQNKSIGDEYWMNPSATEHYFDNH